MKVEIKVKYVAIKITSKTGPKGEEKECNGSQGKVRGVEMASGVSARHLIHFTSREFLLRRLTGIPPLKEQLNCCCYITSYILDEPDYRVLKGDMIPQRVCAIRVND